MEVGTVICTLGLLVFTAAPVSSLTLEECAVTDYAGQCYATLQTQLYFAQDAFAVCGAISGYVTCLESVACDCNLTLSYDIINSITYFYHYYDSQFCQFVTGALPDVKGLPCGKWGGTPGADGELIELSLSVSEYVLALERTCVGFQICYAVYDTDAALALHDRNLTQLCMELDTLVHCLETAACGCPDKNDTLIIENIVTEDQYYRQVCGIVTSDLFARTDIKCDDAGNAVTRTVCHIEEPSDKCFEDYDTEITTFGNTLDVYCPAMKTYIECIEGLACQCALHDETYIYRLVIFAMEQYNISACEAESGPIEVIPGMQCTDPGSGTSPGQTGVVQRVAESQAVLDYEEWCEGIKSCFEGLDERDGAALFEKSQTKLCRSSKIFTECMEMAHCQCGVYNYDNATIYLSNLRAEHENECPTYSPLREDFQCSNITLKDCTTYDLIGQCSKTLENQFFNARSHIELCRAIKDYVDCVEHIGCECNLTLSYDLASSLTYIHDYYERQDCPSTALGELPSTKGIPCTKWGEEDSLDGQLLVLSLSSDPLVVTLNSKCSGYQVNVVTLPSGIYVDPLVVTLNSKCSGYQVCYTSYDSGAALALHNRNLTQLCMYLEELSTCVETAACGCGGSSEQDIVDGVIGEDVYYRQMCQSTQAEEMIPRTEVLCTDDGGSMIRTFCHKPDFISKCVTDFNYKLLLYGDQNDVYCPASKAFLECVEGVACECGMLRDYRVYKALTNATARYASKGCAAVSGTLNVTPGIRCPDGASTIGMEQSIILELAKDQSVDTLEGACTGVKACYSKLDEENGKAYFQKDLNKICMNSKMFVECLEVTFCQCGQIGSESATSTIEQVRAAHLETCVTDAVLRADFECKKDAPGIKCFAHDDCKTIQNSECAYYGECDCPNGYVFSTNPLSCKKVLTSHSVRPRAAVTTLILLPLLCLLLSL